jgi:soluble lytic murein transglycosylase
MKPRDLVLVIGVLLIPVLVWAATRLAGGGEPGEPPAAHPAEVAATAELELPGQTVPTEGVDLPADVERLLAEGRNWRASRRLRSMTGPGADPATVLTAARAEGAWGGWLNVRNLLDGRPWLAVHADAYGLFLLARSREENGDHGGAAAGYARYLAAAPPTERTEGIRAVARFRHARMLLRSAGTDEGIAALDAAHDALPSLAGWADLLAAEALAGRGDTAAVRTRLERGGMEASPPRARRARIAAHREAGDPSGARSLAMSYRDEAETDAARAEMAHLAAEISLAHGDTEGGRSLLRATVAELPGTAGALRAARELAALGTPTPADRLAMAAVFDRHGDRTRAAAQYRAWLAAAGSAPAAEQREVRLRLGRTLFAAGRNAEVQPALAPLAAGSGDGAAEAMLLIGRAQYRSGQQSAAVQTWQRAAQRFPEAPSTGQGLFFAADHQHDQGQLSTARENYRRAFDGHGGTAPGTLAAMRLGGMAFRAGDHAGAARMYDTYRERHPQGGAWLQATYWAGRAHEAMGDAETARARYRALREREPLSYYTVLAAQRLREPYWPLQLAAPPAIPASAQRRVDGWMRTLDVLRAVGMDADAEAEAERRVAEAGDDADLLYPLSEGLTERGYTVHGIRIAIRLQREAGAMNPRLLRMLYPFPYRGIITGEARDAGLDPYLVAALIRQESTFKDRIASPAGARGLMQVMPATGQRLAAGLGIGGWDPELLYSAEINTALGTRFLADQMRRYGGSLPSVFSAYNAGPGRVERWRRYPEFGDEQLFTERIPFQETRDYVKILTRNIAIYRGLYAE